MKIVEQIHYIQFNVILSLKKLLVGLLLLVAHVNLIKLNSDNFAH